MKLTEYALYYKEELLMVGTYKECIKYLNCSQSSFSCMVMRTRSGKLKGNGYTAYIIEDDD